MDEKELFYLLVLQKARNIGTITAKKLIVHSGGVIPVFERSKSELQKISGIGTFALHYLHDKATFTEAEKELRYIQDKKIRYTSFFMDDYPKNLNNCVDAPLMMFYDGTIHFEKQPVISIVGTRNMTNYGRDFVEKFMEDVKVYNPVIVSGFAYGVDITAHKAAINQHLQTIGILAHGLDNIYPKKHKKYVHKVLENGGFYTEYWHDVLPIREYFLQRNRIIAGISDATIIVESARKGGSLVTANIANSYNRDVFAVPGRITDTFSKGCNNLIRTNQAALLHHAKDLAYMLNWEKKEPKKVIQPELFVNLTGDARTVYDFLQQNGRTLLDSISIGCKIPVYKLSGVLLDLELQGLVRPLPGKTFEAI